MDSVHKRTRSKSGVISNLQPLWNWNPCAKSGANQKVHIGLNCHSIVELRLGLKFGLV